MDLKNFTPTCNEIFLQQYESIDAEKVEEIEQIISEEETRLALQSKSDTNIVEDFEKAERDLKVLQKQFAAATKAIADSTAELEECRSRWLPRVEDLVVKVSKAFSDMFAHLGFSGEVQLRSNDEHKYHEFGIEIHVSYRNVEKMRMLEATVQSGGEKSVATMLYLMSLQQVTKCPFRIVDEINQGMDARNERAVYEQIVRCSEAAGAAQSQYFLITPKLLPNLLYKPTMRIISIFRGPWIDPKEWKKTAKGGVDGKDMFIRELLANKKRARLV